jgi:prophage regulatory protein
MPDERDSAKNRRGHMTNARDSEEPNELRFISSRLCEHLTSLSRWTLWRWEKENKFPKSLSLHGKRAWIESEVRQWMADRIQERTSKERPR